MPVCLTVNSQGFLNINSGESLETCTGYIALTKQDYDLFMDYRQVTGSEISTAFGFGFTLVFVGGHLSTYGVKVALRLIRMI